MMCADMVGVEWTDDVGQPRKCTGLLEDISPLGACLQLDDPRSSVRYWISNITKDT